MFRTQRARGTVVIGGIFFVNAAFYVFKEGWTLQAAYWARGVPAASVVLIFGVWYATRWITKGTP